MRQLISADPHLAVEPLEALIINTMHSQDPTRQATLAGENTRLVTQKPLRKPTSILCRLVTMLIDPAIKIPLPQNGLLLRLIDYIKRQCPLPRLVPNYMSRNAFAWRSLAITLYTGDDDHVEILRKLPCPAEQMRLLMMKCPS